MPAGSGIWDLGLGIGIGDPGFGIGDLGLGIGILRYDAVEAQLISDANHRYWWIQQLGTERMLVELKWTDTINVFCLRASMRLECAVMKRKLEMNIL